MASVQDPLSAVLQAPPAAADAPASLVLYCFCYFVLHGYGMVQFHINQYFSDVFSHIRVQGGLEVTVLQCSRLKAALVPATTTTSGPGYEVYAMVTVGAWCFRKCVFGSFDIY